MQPAMQPAVQPLVLPAFQPAASVAVPTGLFHGDGVLSLPQKLMKRIRALKFVEMRELLSGWDRWRRVKVPNSRVVATPTREEVPTPTGKGSPRS